MTDQPVAPKKRRGRPKKDPNAPTKPRAPRVLAAHDAVQKVVDEFDALVQRLSDGVDKNAPITVKALHALKAKSIALHKTVGRALSAADKSGAREAKRQEKALAIINTQLKASGAPEITLKDLMQRGAAIVGTPTYEEPEAQMQPSTAAPASAL